MFGDVHDRIEPRQFASCVAEPRQGELADVMGPAQGPVAPGEVESIEQVADPAAEAGPRCQADLIGAGQRQGEQQGGEARDERRIRPTTIGASGDDSWDPSSAPDFQLTSRLVCVAVPPISPRATSP